MQKRTLSGLLVLATLAMAQTGAPEWRSLFDGKTLIGWKQSGFARQPEAKVEDGAILLPAGAPLTGVTWKGEFPESGYELRFEAKKAQGGDFFASPTFPVGKSFATWVLGGWGGDIVGISSIDGWTAADNETRIYFNFEENRWYKFRLRVEADRIQGWIDDERVVNVGIGGREVGLRPGDIKLSVPLGFASYNTGGAIRKIEYSIIRGK